MKFVLKTVSLQMEGKLTVWFYNVFNSRAQILGALIEMLSLIENALTLMISFHEPPKFDSFNCL